MLYGSSASTLVRPSLLQPARAPSPAHWQPRFEPQALLIFLFSSSNRCSPIPTKNQAPRLRLPRLNRAPPCAGRRQSTSWSPCEPRPPPPPLQPPARRSAGSGRHRATTLGLKEDPPDPLRPSRIRPVARVLLFLPHPPAARRRPRPPPPARRHVRRPLPPAGTRRPPPPVRRRERRSLRPGTPSRLWPGDGGRSCTSPPPPRDPVGMKDARVPTCRSSPAPTADAAPRAGRGCPRWP